MTESEREWLKSMEHVSGSFNTDLRGVSEGKKRKNDREKNNKRQKKKNFSGWREVYLCNLKVSMSDQGKWKETHICLDTVL